MSQELANKIENLKARALMLQKARYFFSDRGVVEVDTPLLTPKASVDAHIDLIPALFDKKTPYYLISSPEYAMKRLLVEGMDDIYQLGKVFRDSEVSYKHNPEFTLCEWYRKAFTFQQMIKETKDFISLFLGDKPLEIITYRELFLKYASIDYLTAREVDLRNVLLKAGIEPHGEDLLNQILGILIEPHLGKGKFTALIHYPASQAALAKAIQKGDEAVAERFEIYYEGVELANGYHELADAFQQKERLVESNKQRQEMNKEPLPIDDEFLEALKIGLPDCCGVAVGFDRLLMLMLNEPHIRNVNSYIHFSTIG